MLNTKANRIPSKYANIKRVNQQQGFTLIELIVTMVLGLIIFSAALQIFLTSSQSSNSQQASSQIQDNVVFGVNQLVKHVRRANYGANDKSVNSGFVLTHDTPQGGIVLTAPTAEPEQGDLSSLHGLIYNGSVIPDNLLSRIDDSDSNMNGLKNDQLTIQYQMPFDEQFDCQGREIPKDYYVIERYFVRNSDNGRKALACASTNYEYDPALVEDGIEISKYTKPNGSKEDAGFGGDGSIVIPNVDYFRVLYGITEQDGFALNPARLSMGYTSVGNDAETTFEGQRITSVQLGLLVASESPISVDDENAELTFDILDKRNAQVNADVDDGKRYLREAYEMTVLIRNGRGRD